MNNWYPNLLGKVPSEVDHAIRKAFDGVYDLQPKVNEALSKINEVVIPGKSSPNTFLHSEDRANIQTALQINGSHPLNVQGLLGQLSQPQKAAASVTVTTSGGGPSTPSVPPVSGQLQITNGELYYFNTQTIPGQYVPVGAIAVLILDTFANLANYSPELYPLGSVFFATDKTVQYINLSILSVNTWSYLQGTDTSSTIASKPTLGTADAGYRLYDSTWDHTWQWSGSAWHYAPEETEPGDIRWRASSTGPLKNGWHVADGSVVTTSQDNATTTSVTLPDMRTYYLKGVAAGSYTGSGSSAVAPILSGSTDPTTIGFTPASPASAGSGSINNPATGTPTTVLEPPFSGGGGGSLGTDPHSHTFSAASISTSGTPPTFGAVPYIRL